MQVFIAGLVQVDLTGVTTYTLSALGNTADQSRPYIIEFIGTPSGDCTVTLPTVAARPGWAINATSGGHNVILTSGGGIQALIPPTGFWVYYYSDGAGNVATLPVEYSAVTTSDGFFTPSGLFQIAPNYYMQHSPSDGAWRWVENGVVHMTLDATGGWSNAGSAAVGANLGVVGQATFTNDGNFAIYKSAGRPTFQMTSGAYMLWDGANVNIEPGIVTNNISATGSVNAGATMSTPSITVSQGYFGIAPNYYLQRSPSDGAWRWVENGTINLTLDTSGNLTARTSVNAPAINSTLLNFAASNFIFYNGAVNYNTTGTHVFNTYLSVLNGGIAAPNYYGTGFTGNVNIGGPIVSGFGGIWSGPLAAPAFNVVSDHRVKIIDGPSLGAGKILDAIPMYDGAMADAPDVKRSLFLAHEVAAALPHAVTGAKDAVDEEGKPVMQQVDLVALVQVMMASIKEIRVHLGMSD
jgi:hypothetical protein